MTSEFAIAVHTLVFLNHKKEYQSSDKIAENVCCNPARVRKILSKLKKANLIETKEGLDGGCFFKKNPKEVTLDIVCKAMGEPPVSASKKTGSVDMECLIASGMSNIMEDIYMKMSEASLQRLSKISIDDIDKRIFK